MALLNADPAQNNNSDNQNQNNNQNPDQNANNQNQNQEEIPGWLQKIEDKNLQANPTLRRLKSEQALAVSYVELRNKLGENPIVIPNEKDPVEKWNEFYAKLGRPEAAEKYAFKPPEGVAFDEQIDKEFRLEAHKLGLTQKQFEGVNSWVANLAKTMTEKETKTHNARVAKAEADLKKEWSGDYDKNLAVANAALKRWGGPDFGKLLAEKGLDGDAAVVKFFASLGKATMSEDELKGLNASNGPTSIKSRAQLEEMMKDPRYWKDPEYRKEVEKGFQALYPQAQNA